ncbi:hypothetical protein ACFRAE_15385 [Sphingobacterium sp. HJSM2_6]|uniref:hypothetical protein n=1 Tax=Sphingobacterium sp. HJSM2_6 TaxID=3366264 RepID=UPI003BCAC8CD
MRLFYTLCLLLFFIYNCFAQSDFNHQINDESKGKLLFEGGIAIPQGQLKNIMNSSPAVGIWILNNINNRSSIGLGGSLFFPKKTYFWYQNQDLETYTKPFAGMLGLRLDHRFSLSPQHTWSILLNTLFGVGFYMYHDIEKEYEYEDWPEWRKEEEEEPSFESAFGTLHFGQGLSLFYKNFGVFARYNYAPYGLFTKKVNQEFGSQHINFGFIFRR